MEMNEKRNAGWDQQRSKKEEEHPIIKLKKNK